MRLVIATRNTHKTGEIRAILCDLVEEIADLTTFPDLVSPEESGSTFTENAIIKALAAAGSLGPDALVLSDDSGLEVDALGGAPGVHSARYAGPGATDTDNRDKLLRELQADGARGKVRSARFRCVIILARNGAVLETCDGAIEGVIANREKGDNGFGYDPIFIPEEYCETFGQLPAAVKNALSHRARALEKIKTLLPNHL